MEVCTYWLPIKNYVGRHVDNTNDTVGTARKMFWSKDAKFVPNMLPLSCNCSVKVAIQKFFWYWDQMLNALITSNMQWLLVCPLISFLFSWSFSLWINYFFIHGILLLWPPPVGYELIAKPSHESTPIFLRTTTVLLMWEVLTWTWKNMLQGIQSYIYLLLSLIIIQFWW